MEMMFDTLNGGSPQWGFFRKSVLASESDSLSESIPIDSVCARYSIREPQNKLKRWMEMKRCNGSKIDCEGEWRRCDFKGDELFGLIAEFIERRISLLENKLQRKNWCWWWIKKRCDERLPFQAWLCTGGHIIGFIFKTLDTKFQGVCSSTECTLREWRVH